MKNNHDNKMCNLLDRIAEFGFPIFYVYKYILPSWMADNSVIITMSGQITQMAEFLLHRHLGISMDSIQDSNSKIVFDNKCPKWIIRNREFHIWNVADCGDNKEITLS